VLTVKTAHMCVLTIVKNCRTQQHRTVLIIFPIFPLILQTLSQLRWCVYWS